MVDYDKAWADEASRTVEGAAGCNDCGLFYSDMGVDLVLPDQVWKVLSPDASILCPTCICRRLKNAGATTVLLAWPDNFNYQQGENNGRGK